MHLSMDDVLRALPPPTTALLEALVSGAGRCGVRVFLVGGPVRDLLLECPIRDVDLVIVGGEGAAAASVARAGAPEGARLVEHERFGTVTVATGDASIDVATVRRESYRHPGALPEVEPGSLEEDLQRRDFSVNALALPLGEAPRKKPVAVIDAEDGLRDLEERRLRVLHKRSFHDDPTRALRAARLAPRLGFSLTRGSRSVLRDALRDGAFGAVSGDRLRREIERAFEDAASGLNPAEVFRRLADWHVLSALEPGLTLDREAVAPLRRLGRLIAEPPWRSPQHQPWAAGLAVWLAPAAAALRRRTLQRFSVRGELAKRLAAFPVDRDRWFSALASARGRGVVDAVLRDVDEERLAALYASAPAPIRRRIVRFAAEDRHRRLPVSGADLVSMGLSGPSIGRALARIRVAYLDGGLANREEAMALAQELARSRKPARGGARRPRSGKG
jgi:tRNA nucleotidyltransferase (CCA-adding enzyme)